MTKRDYDLIARVMAKVDPLSMRNMVVLNMCREMKKDNPNFRPSLFIKACGAEHGVLLALED